MKYAISRVAILFFMMVSISFLVFVAFDVIPGDAAVSMLGTEATAEEVAAKRVELGLDRPLVIRYATWLVKFLRGDMGMSYSYRQPVSALLAGKIKLTLFLSIFSFFLIAVVSIPLALATIRFVTRNSELTVFTVAVDQFFMAMPSFFIGIILSWFFGIALHIFTPGFFPNFSDDFFNALKHIFFAALAVSIPRIAMVVRMIHSNIIGEMQKDYVRTAIVRGNNRRQVLINHVLRNSLVPTITFMAQTLAEIFAGSIVVEQVFAIPGVGRMLVASIANRDYPVVQAIVVIISFWVVASNTASDIINSVIDPRLKLSGDL